MKKKQRCIGILKILLLILSTSVFASESDFTNTIAFRFSSMWQQAPQEKVYLHTDKPFFYSAGEDIWFNAHIVNASTHIPDTRSQFVYVELIDQSDSVVTRVKSKRQGAGAAGKITISPETEPGEYVLRAYTYWMQNASASFFFHKKIHIGNLIDDRVQIQSEFGQIQNGQLPVTLTFTNTFSTPLTGKSVEISTSNSRNKLKYSKFTTNKQGEVHFLTDAEEVADLKRIIKVRLNEPGLIINKKILLPSITHDYDVQFFPESGTFLDNQIQTVGFKAICNDGMAVNISGKLYNQDNEEICEFASSNKGMGKIILQTFPGERFYAIIKAGSGPEKRFDLPTTSSVGIGIKLNAVKGKIYFRILNQSQLNLNNLFLLIHARGVIQLLTPLKEEEGFISEKLLPAGINSFSIIDSAGNTWCERICFIRNEDFPIITMQTDKQKYDKRELVDLSFRLTSNDSIPIHGNFSVSVTDSYLVKSDSINNDILSYLLLSSDIKGYIEEPKQYFTDNSRLTRDKTDLLMLTQGWRRFNTCDIVKGKYPQTTFYLEVGQTISGSVLNLFNRPVRNTEVIFLSNYKNQISTAKTDSSGQFIMDGIQFPDSTQIILKAKSRSKITDVELIPDPDQFPDSKTNIPPGREQYVANNDDYLRLTKERYYNEGGMLVINLEEFTVKGETPKAENDSYYSGAADNSLDSKKLESYGNQTILDIIRSFPGVLVSGDVVSIRGATGNPLFLIDGVETEETEDLQFLNATDIEEISLFKGASASLFGSRGGNGVIAITLKKGTSLPGTTPPSLVRLTPLGYQKPAEFYTPKYEADSMLKQPKEDLRTTIYWNPDATTDEDGHIRLKFYTADKSNDYRVELEGVSENGKICQFQGSIRRK